MKVLITGMSGTGKSTTVAALRREGVNAIDLDEQGYCEWQPCEGNPTGGRDGFDWGWNERAVGKVLEAYDGRPLVIAGCAPNMGRFVDQFDEVILLSANISTMLRRVADRSNNKYGKAAAEISQIIQNKLTIEPVLRRISTYILDSDCPLDELVAEVAKIGRLR